MSLLVTTEAEAAVAYVRRKRSGNGTYYQLVRSVRIEGKPRQELLAYLGKHSTVEEALAEYDNRAEEYRRWEREYQEQEIRKYGAVLPAGRAATYRKYAEEWEARASKLRRVSDGGTMATL